MRFVLVMVLAGLVALPLSVSAQGTDKSWVEEFYPELAPREAPRPPPPESAPKGKGTTPEPSVVQEPAPASGPAPKEPALELKLDDAAVEVAPSPRRTPDGYTLEEMERRVKRAKIGLGVSAGLFALGIGLVVGSGVYDNRNPTPEDQFLSGGFVALLTPGMLLQLGGMVGMILSGVRLAKNKRDRNWLRQARHGTPRRAQWDLARSRLVF
jgi:hypothetical protein